MQRFKIGDAVLILPKFAHLYPSNSGIVVRVQSDQFRPTLNEYTVRFRDDSTQELFEFQILEHDSEYTTLIAALAFDSQRQTEISETRGVAPKRQVILKTPSIDVDLTIQLSNSRASIIGQILQTGATTFTKRAEVRLMKESVLLAATAADSAGIFKFNDIPRGGLNILVLIPQSRLRILGECSI